MLSIMGDMNTMRYELMGKELNPSWNDWQKLCKRESTKQFHNSKIKFPLVFKKIRPPTRKLKTTYKATRPNLFM